MAVVCGVLGSICAVAQAQAPATVELGEVVKLLNESVKTSVRARVGKDNEADIIWGPRAIMVTSFADDWEAAIGRSMARAVKLRKRPGLIVVRDQAFTPQRYTALKVVAREKKFELGLLDLAEKECVVPLAPLPRLNINTVTQEDLEVIPGIGATVATSIIQVREQLGGFRSPADLRQVPGLGTKKIQSLFRAHLLIP